VVKISGTIFLDLDGTLLDTSRRHYKLYKDILEMKNPVNNESVLSKEKFWLMKRAGEKTRDILPESLSDEIIAGFEEEWLQKIEKKSYLRYDEIFPGVKDILSDLSIEFDLVLVTLRSSTENLHWELSNLNLKNYFKAVISGKGPKKNLVEIYLAGNHEGKICFLIGDTEEDIKTGLELKIPVVSVTCGIRSREFLEGFNPDYCIKDLNGIADVIKSI
jgi:phosphoglycolate phosphatase-like HAD superfamily hydrolase